MFSDHPVWNNEQKLVLNSKSNIIVRGCAGSGKTLLAIHLAKKLSYEEKARVLILVYTKALGNFIENALSMHEKLTIDVFNSDKWNLYSHKNYDYLIIDEAQDFSIDDIKAFQQHATRGVYIFLDENQKLYKKSKENSTLTFASLQKFSEFPVIDLKTNYRISTSILDFLKDVFPNNNLDNSTKALSIKPKIVRCNSALEELKWIRDYIVTHPLEKIAILLRWNESYSGFLFPNGKKKENQFFGVLEVRDNLIKDNIAVGFKFHQEDHLNFSDGGQVNILTIHSSKGIEFDTVIIPFFNYLDKSESQAVDYVAMTRCKSNLIILYSEIASKRLYPADTKKIEGEIREFFYETDWDRDRDIDKFVETEKQKRLERVRKGLQ
jgi:superfamily I DNA/RNA helicase